MPGGGDWYCWHFLILGGACPLAARQDRWCLVAAQPGTRGPVGVLCPRPAWRRVIAGRGSAGRMEG